MEEELVEQPVTLNDYLRILYRGRWIILISFLIVFTTTAYYTFTEQPVYEASALVMIKEEGGVQRKIFEGSSYIERETSINNQVEILRSRTLAEDVIHRLQNSSTADSLFILGKGSLKKRFSILSFVRGLLSSLRDRNKAKFSQTSTADFFDAWVGSFRGSITVEPRRNTDMIDLKVRAFSPSEASFIANTWMEAYRDWDISESRGEVSEVRKFLEEKLKDVQVALTASEEALKEYKETEKVTELTAETQQTIEQLAEFEAIYQAAKTDLEANEKRLAHLRANLSESQRFLVEEAASISSPVVKQLEAQLAQLIGRRAALEKQVTEAGLSSEYGNLNDLDKRIEGIKEKIIEETKKIVEGGITPLHTLDYSESIITNILQIETDNKALVARIDYLAGIVEQYNRELNVLPEKSLKLARLRRETTVNNNIFMMLREKYEENRIAEAGQIGSVRIVDRAKPPTSPIKPRKKMNLFLGVVIGLGLGMGLTFLREYLDNSLKSIEDVERSGFSVLGSIPFISPQKVAPHAKDQNGDILRIESRLITHFAPKSPISEAYRTLRTNLQYSKADHPIKTILVTSSGPGEGKSTSVANLAITFAQMGSKTLIIDTDLRRPVLHAIFDQARTEGLTNILIGKTTLQDVVRSTKIENLDLLVSGTLPPNPSELLASAAMEKLLKTITDRYDIVLFDSPPVIAVTDAAVLARKLDGIVLVVKSGETSRDAILRSRVLLENVNAHIFGVMLNGVKSDHMYGSYYYYYHHYYYYGDGKHKKRKSRKALV